MQTNLHFENEAYMVVDESKVLEVIRDDIKKIPNPTDQLMPGIIWGCYSQLFTPAYWKVQYLMYNVEDDFRINYRLGDNILEETVACLLGGFGLKAELGLAAFNRMKERQLITPQAKYDEILASLSEPFTINCKPIRYRFPNQKTKFIHQFLNRSDLGEIPNRGDIELRDWLLTVNGIGPKTASWITRNFLDSEKVAIIDVHIYRACAMMGLYSQNFDIQKDYITLEQLFLDFCSQIEVQPSKMDALIWLQMKDSARSGLIYNL